MWSWRRVAPWLLLCAVGLSACGGLKQSFEDSKRATTALKSELGIDARISFRTTNGHTTVAVQLSAPPSGDAAVTKRNITDVVNKNFRAKVERVDIMF
jgi:hypothetical protein